MGRTPNHKKPTKKKYSHKSARRAKFLVKGDDMIYGELKQQESQMVEPAQRPLDEDLPGLGQFYCLHCDRYFTTAAVQAEHFKSKAHRRRVKKMQGDAPHTQLDAELAAGMGRPDNGPKLTIATA